MRTKIILLALNIFGYTFWLRHYDHSSCYCHSEHSSGYRHCEHSSGCRQCEHSSGYCHCEHSSGYRPCEERSNLSKVSSLPPYIVIARREATSKVASCLTLQTMPQHGTFIARYEAISDTTWWDCFASKVSTQHRALPVARNDDTRVIACNT